MRRTTTLKELRNLVKDGFATELTETDYELYERTDVIGMSYGIYGMTGAWLRDRTTGDDYVIIGRGTTLFSMV